MRNITKISLVIFSAVLLSACTAKTPNGQNQAENNQDTQTEQNQPSTLRELLALGKNQKCTVTSSITDEDGTKTDTASTIFISGKKMAQEVAVTSTDKERPNVNMRMISDGDYMYTWNTETKGQGMKIKITEPEAGSNDNSKPENGNISWDDKIDVKCSPWIADNGKFVIPSDVQFSDLSEMMKNIPTMPANIPTVPAE